ncbi:glycerol kinase GlpK [Aestuariibacter sp. AA17]|uniref:Glycerol kinase n=1 Tax=Fluctibacter corallii TaxID=2984329 RepID=A0ABT3A873_9ALTE|nr:glycerol kinase GlpK [Aestuariibacter sp. AA17]MCV2884877.1 glycerol kinase GlpK [Aestuariibacter sp. AA17]
MTVDSCILAIDQGTTSSRAIVFSPFSDIVSVSQQEFQQHYPADGWVEHDPEDIWNSTLSVCKKALAQAKAKGAHVAAIGITNQRETTIIWDKETGQPIYNGIVWQDRRTANSCRSLRDSGLEKSVSERTGLLLDPYFSATKIKWILDNVEGAKARAASGKLAFGTVDSFLIWRLTGGTIHATDVTNASRTNLYNIHDMRWDDELLKLFGIPKAILPEVKQCNDDYGHTQVALLGESIPILGVAGDQQAAAIGQCCFEKGNIKSTYGTGCFVLLNTGAQAVQSNNKLLSTIAYTINDTTHYALEGSIFIAGAAVQWLRDGIQVIERAADTQRLAKQLDYNHGVYMVPAFAGLGAPYWQPHARGAIYGLTRASDARHLARAALEAVCYQTSDLLHAMQQDGVKPTALRVDGGMVANDWACQFLSDILNISVQRPRVMETTALGAAYLAGLQAGIYASTDALCHHNSVESTFTASLDETTRRSLLSGWQRAVSSTLDFAK